MNNTATLILSFLLVFGILILSELMVKFFSLPKEESRKFVHIGVSNWWLIALLGFSSWRWAIIPPVVFIVLNLVSWYTGMFGAMERKPRDPGNLGTVYFPLALLILVILTWHDSPVFANSAPYVGGLGILAMGYGDGFAAIVGARMGKHKFRLWQATKSLEGSLTMLIASFLTSFCLLTATSSLSAALLPAFFLAALATVIEAFTPLGLDNLTVPLAVSLIWQFFFI